MIRCVVLYPSYSTSQQRLISVIQHMVHTNINNAIRAISAETDMNANSDPTVPHAFVVFDYGTSCVITPVSQQSINFYTNFYTSHGEHGHRPWFSDTLDLS